MNPAAMEGKVMTTVKGPDGKVTYKFDSPKGDRVFWSGGGNEAVESSARQFATENGMTTLEMTRAGKNLTNLTQNMSYPEKAPMWQRLSATYAEGAYGSVHVFQNAGGIGVKSVWGSIEYPILQQNGVNIIFHIVP